MIYCIHWECNTGGTFLHVIRLLGDTEHKIVCVYTYRVSQSMLKQGDEWYHTKPLSTILCKYVMTIVHK